MIHITKAKGGYMVVTTGKKREVLATSEILKTKQAAYQNALSQAYFFNHSERVFLQDDTADIPKCYGVEKKGKKIIKHNFQNVDAAKVFKVKIEKYKPNI